MIVKDINECDFVNYKVPSMFIITSSCTFKCDKLNKCQVCQNWSVAREPNISISADKICEKYVNNPITKAIVIGGLEPFDTDIELIEFIHCLREQYNCNDDVIIYTGYTEEEIEKGWRDWPQDEVAPKVEQDIYAILRSYPNIIIKFGRYIAGDKPHFDPVLGVNLSSDNQYAKKIT